MLTQNNYYQTTQAGFESKTLVKSFMSNVFAWMGIALALTAFTAYYFASSEELIRMLVKAEGGMTMLGWVVMLAPIGFVLAMSLGFQRFSVGTLTILFGIYAVLMGASLSFILLIYTSASIFLTFAVTAGIGIEERIRKFEQNHDDYNSIMIKALADRLAEAFTELLHEKVRKEYWGYGLKERLTLDELIIEK